MKAKFLSYMAIGLGLILNTSCQNEELTAVQDKTPRQVKLSINLMPDIAMQATRAGVDMTPNAIVNIKKLWVGVYDVETGEKLNDEDIVDLQYRATATGQELYDAIEVDFTAVPGENVCVVGVANYEDVNAYQDGLAIPLEDQLRAADNWSTFMEIYLNCESAYSGLHGTTTPVLTGFLIDKTSSPLALIDQYADEPGINLKHPKAEDVIFFDPTTADLSNKFLRLRKLVSEVNVKITNAPEIEISNVQYKRMNIPKRVFMAERYADVEGNHSAELSPNKADQDPQTYYQSDEDWIIADAIYNFSFQHFENKHWARPGINVANYSDRERRENGAFWALAESPDDWNNYASYFVISMNILDKAKGTSAQVEYTVHEGYCNNAMGEYLVDENGDITDDEIYKDFSCFRNTSYTYNIRVNGIDNIITQVTTGGMHFDDQRGTLWEIEYPSGYNYENFVGAAGGTFSDFITFVNDSETPDFQGESGVCFRVSGTEDDGDAFDIIYNMPDEIHTQYTTIWPMLAAHSTFFSGETDIESIDIPAHVLDGFTIGGMNIKEFVKSNPVAGKYTVEVNANQAGKGIRAIYIGNRKDVVDGFYDADGCTSCHTIYAVVQED